MVDLDETQEDVAIPASGIHGGRTRTLELVFQKGLDLRARVRSFPLFDHRVLLGRRPGGGGIELSDSRASREHAEIVYDGRRDVHVVRDLGSRNGTHLNGARIEKAVLVDGAILRICDALFVYVDADIPPGLQIPDDRAGVSVVRAVAEATADLAAPAKIPMLLVGPTGAGKELMARRIHEKSGRKGPLVPVNCATFSKELIASELFGHVAGAFSGAHSKRDGLFLTAAGGTLFLDEVGELPLEQQPALLRALQEGKVRPVGADREVAVDVRVVAATHQPLAQLADRGAFRKDLYARLAGFVIDLPGLAERREEVLPLFAHFLGDDAKPLSTEAAQALLVYDWPHNIRELQHAAERAQLLSQNTERIELPALPPEIQSPPRPPPTAAPVSDGSEELTKAQLVELLRAHGGNVAGVARSTGKHRQQIYRWLRRDDLDPRDYRPDADAPEA